MIARQRIIPILLILAATLATFAPVIRNDFVLWDDPETISQNPRIATPSVEGVAYYWNHSAAGLYVPLTYSLWAALAAVHRPGVTAPDPLVFHAASAALHAISALLVYAILRRLLGEAKATAACLGALLFALHPVQVEAVAWASGAKDLLCGVLSLLAILHYLRFAKGGSRWRYVGALAFLMLALLSKPAAVVMPLLMAAIDRVIVGRDWKRIVQSVVPMLLIVAPFVVVAAAFQRPQTQLSPVPVWQRPLIACDAISFYVRKLIYPTPLTIDYARTPDSVLARGPIIWLEFIAPLALLAVAIWTRRRAPLVCAGIVVFIMALLPVLGLVPFMFQIHSTVADHYLYLPMLGVAIIAGWAVSRHSNAVTHASAALILVLFSVVSIHQILYWRDSVTLFAHAAKVTPDVASVQGNYGRALADAGRLDDAIPHLQRAAELSPLSRVAQMFLAQAYVYSNHFEQALAPAEQAVSLALQQGDSDTAWERVLLAKALAGVGRYDDAEQQLVRASQIRPNDRTIAAELAAVRERRK
jgi:hypothetical protein